MYCSCYSNPVAVAATVPALLLPTSSFCCSLLPWKKLDRLLSSLPPSCCNLCGEAAACWTASLLPLCCWKMHLLLDGGQQLAAGRWAAACSPLLLDSGQQLAAGRWAATCCYYSLLWRRVKEREEEERGEREFLQGVGCSYGNGRKRGRKGGRGGKERPPVCCGLLLV